MKITCDVPCGLDPQAIKRVFSVAWKAAARDTGWKHPLPKRISRIRTRKGNNAAWVSAMGSLVMVSVHIYINPRLSMAAHCDDWYRALGGNDVLHYPVEWNKTFPKAPKPTKRTKHAPVTAEKLIVARERVEEWEAKRKDAQRALKLAKTKLRSYKAQVRALERSVREQAPEKSIGYDSKAFAAHMRERIGDA